MLSAALRPKFIPYLLGSWRELACWIAFSWRPILKVPTSASLQGNSMLFLQLFSSIGRLTGWLRDQLNASICQWASKGPSETNNWRWTQESPWMPLFWQSYSHPWWVSSGSLPRRLFLYLSCELAETVSPHKPYGPPTHSTCTFIEKTDQLYPCWQTIFLHFWRLCRQSWPAIFLSGLRSLCRARCISFWRTLQPIPRANLASYLLSAGLKLSCSPSPSFFPSSSRSL